MRVGDAQKLVVDGRANAAKHLAGQRHIALLIADELAAVAGLYVSGGARLAGRPHTVEGEEAATGTERLVRDPKELQRLGIIQVMENRQGEDDVVVSAIGERELADALADERRIRKPCTSPATPAAVTPAAATTVGPAAFDRTQPPVLGPPPAVVMPAVVRRELPNGLQIVEVERHNLPVADFILLVRSGTEADPASKPGLTSLASDLLTRGTLSRSATAIAEQQALLGVSLRIASTWDQTTIALHTPIAQLDSALALFADVALHPAFAPAEVDRAKRDR